MLAEWRKMQRCAEGFDFFFLVHDETGLLQPLLKNEQCFFVDNKQILELGYPFQSMWHQCQYPLLLFAKKHPEYRYYWMIEYDVRFTGRWSMFWKQFRDCDFLATNVNFRSPQNEHWRHFKHIDPVYHGMTHLGSFFPLVRFSHAAVNALHQLHGQGFAGHCEFVVPTLLYNYGYSVADINDQRFRHGRKSKYRYYSSKSFNIPGNSPRLIAGLQKNWLYHPVYGLTKKGLEVKWNRYKSRLAHMVKVVIRFFSSFRRY